MTYIFNYLVYTNLSTVTQANVFSVTKTYITFNNKSRYNTDTRKLLVLHLHYGASRGRSINVGNSVSQTNTDVSAL